MISNGEYGDCRGHYFAYIDIMGFKEFVQGAVDRGTTAQAIEEVHRVVRQAEDNARAFKELEDGEWESLSLQVFSDLICISIDESAEKAAYAMQALVGYLLLHLIVPEASGEPMPEREEVLRLPARGAICRGQHYAEENVLFSPVLIECHKTEQESAVFPRVVVSDCARRGQHASPPVAPDFEANMLWKDFDGSFFVNYLYVATGRGSAILKWVLKEHRDTIQRKLSEHGAGLRVAPKYWWLASYHNAFCRFAAARRDAPKGEDLLIPDAALPGHERLGYPNSQEETFR